MPLLSSCGWISAELWLMYVIKMQSKKICVTCCLLLAGDLRCRSTWSCAASVSALVQLLEEAPCELMAVEEHQRASFYRNGVHCASGQDWHRNGARWLTGVVSLSVFPVPTVLWQDTRVPALHTWWTIHFWLVTASPKPVIAKISLCSRQFARQVCPCDVLTFFTSPGRTLVTITFVFPTSRMSVL